MDSELVKFRQQEIVTNLFERFSKVKVDSVSPTLCGYPGGHAVSGGHEVVDLPWT